MARKMQLKSVLGGDDLPEHDGRLVVLHGIETEDSKTLLKLSTHNDLS
jgi:hypothetical protein